MKELDRSPEEMIREMPVVLLQLGDDACGPCHAIRFRIDQWLEEHPEIEARYVDIPSHLELCAQMGIMSAPAVIAWLDGKKIIQKSGYFSLDQIFDQIERYMTLRNEGV